MSHNWKPGDVAILTMGDGAERIAMRDCDGSGWGLVGAPNHSRGLTVVSARPLVVLDPESTEDAGRLTAAYMTNPGIAAVHDLVRGRMAHALRELANPTPPKPDEPTGLGAVVEDAEGARWVRVTDDGGVDKHWRRSDMAAMLRHWQIVDAVRVLSEGVPE